MAKTVTTGWKRAARSVVGVAAIVCAVGLAGCAKGAKETATRSDSLRGGAGTGGPMTCGNGVREGSEECDGTDLGITTCESLGFASGVLLCTTSCTFDRSMCGSTPVATAGAGG